jgi:S1-C subfamily serine protease
VAQIVAHDEVSRSTHLGTGWFIDKIDDKSKGYSREVVTNFHVIAGSFLDQVRVKTAKGELLKVQALDYWAFDPDLACLTVTPATVSDYSPYAYEVWPSLPVGDSSDAREGERVLVIGNPEGLYGTVSDGIISVFRDKGNIIQIAAPISPGSSGSRTNFSSSAKKYSRH